MDTPHDQRVKEETFVESFIRESYALEEFAANGFRSGFLNNSEFLEIMIKCRELREVLRPRVRE